MAARESFVFDGKTFVPAVEKTPGQQAMWKAMFCYPAASVRRWVPGEAIQKILNGAERQAVAAMSADEIAALPFDPLMIEPPAVDPYAADRRKFDRQILRR